jgi:hypothetical protein
MVQKAVTLALGRMWRENRLRLEDCGGFREFWNQRMVLMQLWEGQCRHIVNAVPLLQIVPKVTGTVLVPAIRPSTATMMSDIMSLIMITRQRRRRRGDGSVTR